MLTFQEWCELNGKRWTGAATFEEFSRNADDYQAYRFDSIADAWDAARRERRVSRGDIVSSARKRWLATARSDRGV